MAKKNLLAAIASEHQNHYLFKEFEWSLPEGTKLIWNSEGHEGNLENIVKLNGKVKKAPKSKFRIYQGDSFENLRYDYFASHENSSVSEISDTLRFKVMYLRKEGMLNSPKRITKIGVGPINDIIKKYQEFGTRDPEETLREDIYEIDALKEMSLSKRLIGKGQKLQPTAIAFGLETVDGRYLLHLGGPYGFYKGVLPVKNVSQAVTQ